MIRTSLNFTTRSSEAGRAAPARPDPRIGARALASGRTSRVRTCDYNAPAGLYIRLASRLQYRPFESASLALRHANEELTPRQLLSCTMEVDDARFAGEEMRALYLAPLYPLPRAAMAAIEA